MAKDELYKKKGKNVKKGQKSILFCFALLNCNDFEHELNEIIFLKLSSKLSLYPSLLEFYQYIFE